MSKPPMGRAAKYAFDPKILLSFLMEYETMERQTVRTRRSDTRSKYDLPVEVRLINGFRVDQTDSRTLRRWRTVSTGVTEKAANKLLRRHGLKLEEFRKWAAVRGLSPVLWDRQ